MIGTAAVAYLAIHGRSLLFRADARWPEKKILITAILRHARYQAWKISEEARPWPTNHSRLPLKAAEAGNAGAIYKNTNIWLAHLSFSRTNWQALEPKEIEHVSNFIRPDGMVLLRNPKAPRNGLAGVFGYAFDWTHADLEFGGAAFHNVAARAKGNFNPLMGGKLPFKIDLNKFEKDQRLAGTDQLAFNNLMFDYSYMAEALGLEIFREAAVPAPRTAYVWLDVTVESQFERKPFGLYVMIEPVNEAFTSDRFGAKGIQLFKPSTYSFLEYLGADWNAYASIYDLKTKATDDQKRRLIDFALLVSNGKDAEFNDRISQFLDLDEFARFLACEVLISNYDSILSTGQNFYMYLDPRSGKFGFIPWDLDAAWGRLSWLASVEDQENASIMHPWVGENRFLERLFALQEFQRLYRKRLEDFLPLLAPAKIQGRIDELARIIREPIAAESSFRLDKFEQEISAKPVHHSKGETPDGFNHPAQPLKDVAAARYKSIRDQLDGKSSGLVIRPPHLK